MKTALLFVLLLTAVCRANAQSRRVGEIADSLVRSGNTPALAYGAVSPDSVFISSAAGVLEIGQQEKVNRFSLFHLGSNTKAITGFIAGYLVEQGKINWETRFFELFPEMRRKSKKEYREVTLKDLLSHRARVQPFTSGAEFMTLPGFEGTVSEARAAFVKQVFTLAPVAEGKVFNYSNAGYSAAALMLEKASGKTWEQLVSEVFGKVNINDYAFGWPALKENQPYGHWALKGMEPEAHEPDGVYTLKYIQPAGDLSMSISAYVEFLRLNLEGLSGKGNLLKPETYRYLHTCLPDYAIGWINYGENGESFSEHAGSAGTFYCYTVVDRTALRAYIAIASSADKNAQYAVGYLLEVLEKSY